jgi:hypothetical protein
VEIKVFHILRVNKGEILGKLLKLGEENYGK